MNKFKLLMIGDIPLCNSGVGTQFRYIINGLVKTGTYKITVFGGAIKHQHYEPMKIKEWGDDVIIIPVDGYGTPDLLRQALDFEKPDAIWLITDPRFYDWIFKMSDEIHQVCPIIYWNLWDNADKETWPKYNKHYYDCCDALPAINKLTHNFLKEAGYNTTYIPHAVPEENFKILSKEEIRRLKKIHLGEGSEDKFVLFYNSRNAMRKKTGTCMMAFQHFLKSLPEEERDNCVFLMKTPIHDREGQDLNVIVKDIPFLKGRVAFADRDLSLDQMNELYNVADITIALSSEEGFGLSILESLMVGTPIIAGKTGGIQDQVHDEETGEAFGFLMEPDARSLIGSQTTPYIWSDHFSHEKAGQLIKEMYDRKKSHGDHKEFFAKNSRESVLRRFNMKDMIEKMDSVIINTILNFKEKQNEVSYDVVSI